MDAYLVESRYGFLGPLPEDNRQALTAVGWRLARSVPSTNLWIRGRTSVRDTAWGWIVGELFERGAGRPAAERPASLQDELTSVEASCAALVRDFWGRYVSIFPQSKALMRDPSGHLDCLTWKIRAGWCAGSELPADLPVALSPPALSVDWAAIASLLADSSGTGVQFGLEGVSQVLPGALRTFTADCPDKMVWLPATFAQRPHSSYEASRKAVFQAVEESLVAETASSDKLLVEISGGLDSAIVASSVVRAGAGDRARFIHFHVKDPGGDERAYARAVAERSNVDLLEIVKPELRLEKKGLEVLPVGPRPSVNVIDYHYDQVLAQEAQRHGASRILTGQGGDMVFFQTPSRQIATEFWGRWARLPRADPLWRQLETAARWNRCSVWSLIGEAVREKTRRADGPPQHPWQVDEVAPAKARQVASLIRAQAFHGASLRAGQVHVVHPLLHQPVLEAVLAAPIMDLTRGGRGRSLARDAFADQIPSMVRTRRSKGNLTTYYGRMLLRSLPVLKAYLLDGRLAAEGVLDRQAIELMLDADQMIHDGDYPRLFEIIAVEAFVRHWEGRGSSLAAATEGDAKRSASHGSTCA
jgi:asparagine synthase (glutamine-hydrolysing)